MRIEKVFSLWLTPRLGREGFLQENRDMTLLELLVILLRGWTVLPFSRRGGGSLVINSYQRPFLLRTYYSSPARPSRFPRMAQGSGAFFF